MKRSLIFVSDPMIVGTFNIARIVGCPASLAVRPRSRGGPFAAPELIRNKRILNDHIRSGEAVLVKFRSDASDNANVKDPRRPVDEYQLMAGLFPHFEPLCLVRAGGWLATCDPGYEHAGDKHQGGKSRTYPARCTHDSSPGCVNKDCTDLYMVPFNIVSLFEE
jgi:hypothetical protein